MSHAADVHADNNVKEKVSVDVIQHLDGHRSAFIGFKAVHGGTEYLIKEMNGEPEPLPGNYQIPNRFGIESFELMREGTSWFWHPVWKKESHLLS